MPRRVGSSETAWCQQDIALVRRRWNSDGKSAGAIANELGRTRNSVCGLIHRFRDQFADRSQMSAKLRAKKAEIEVGNQPKPIAAPTAWTAEQKSQAVRLWAEWRTIKEMAATLDKGEVAVKHFIKRNRDKFPHRYKTDGNGRRLVQRRPLPLAAPKTQPVQVMAPPAEPIFRGIGISLVELTARACRYPVEGEKETTLFCGHAVWRGSWCQHHAARVFQARAA